MIRNSTIAIVLTAAVLLIAAPVLAEKMKHPSEGFDPKPMPINYGSAGYGLGPEMNFGDITFHSPYPDPDTLTDAEKYMVAGCVDSDYGGGMTPWYMDVFMMVDAIRGRSGIIPDEFNHQMLQACAIRPDYFDKDSSARFRSPITGEFPRLDAAEFEAGQVYIRLLTEEEQAHFASIFKEYDQNWNQGVQEFYQTGELLPIEIATGIYYMRVYGEHDVIFAGILYQMKMLKEPDYEWPSTPPPEQRD